MSRVNMKHLLREWALFNVQILFITGLGGSGKTTFAQNFARACHVPVVGLDQLSRDFAMVYGRSAYKAWSDDEYSDKVFAYINKTHENRQVIVEGAQVLRMKFDEVSQHAVVLFDTPWLLSTWRMLRRDFGWEHWKQYKSIRPFYHMHKNWEAQQRLHVFKEKMQQLRLGA